MQQERTFQQIECFGQVEDPFVRLIEVEERDSFELLAGRQAVFAPLVDLWVDSATGTVVR